VNNSRPSESQRTAEAEVSTDAALRLSERQRFQQSLSRSTGDKTDWQGALETAASELAQACESQLITVVRSGQTSDQTVINGLTAPLDNLTGDVRKQLALFARNACHSFSTQVQVLQNESGTTVISVPLRHSASHFEALQVLHDFTDARHRDRIVGLVELTAGVLREWLSTSVSRSLQARLDVTTSLVDLLGRMDACRLVEDASHVLVNCLSKHFDGAVVVLALTADERDSVKFSARSQQPNEPEPPEDWTSRLESALQESLVRDSFSVEPPFDPADRHSLLAHRRFVQFAGCGCMISCPLRNASGKVLGAWGMLFATQPDPDAEAIRFFRAAEHSVASSLDLVRRAQPGRVSKFIDRLSIAKSGWKTRAILSAVVMTFCLMLIPMDYNVKCNCELQPVQRRFVASPFDGPLESSLVEPGDLVTNGQLLAKLDGREIRWELAGVEAEKNRASRERDGHKARQDFGQARITEFEVRRHEVRRQLLENRILNLEIRSPVDGIVISGDWKKSEGIPLRLGQSLFEIAPLDGMVVEVGIPEEDIGYVHVGQTLHVSLDAVSGKTWEGTVERIHPRSEFREQEHVYICEMLIDNSSNLLRPGMRGRAKIATVLRPLGWNLLHKPWNSLVMWLRYSI
jgi:hypothetical protein